MFSELYVFRMNQYEVKRSTAAYNVQVANVLPHSDAKTPTILTFVFDQLFPHQLHKQEWSFDMNIEHGVKVVRTYSF